MSKRVVIDASIFRSAGESNSPAAKVSRELLAGVLKICHKVVFSTDLYEEWRRHRSNYSASWLAKMTAKKKVVRLGEVENDKLRSRIASQAKSDDDKAALLKDTPLIEAALLADCIILSRDGRICGRMKEVALRVGEIGQVIMINPMEAPEETLAWLEDDAPDKRKLRLRSR